MLPPPATVVEEAGWARSVPRASCPQWLVAAAAAWVACPVGMVQGSWEFGEAWEKGRGGGGVGQTSPVPARWRLVASGSAQVMCARKESCGSRSHEEDKSREDSEWIRHCGTGWISCPSVRARGSLRNANARGSSA